MKKRKRKQKYDEKYLQKLIEKFANNRKKDNVNMLEVLDFMRGRENKESSN